jgi:para-nitrobenzyl esterase
MVRSPEAAETFAEHFAGLLGATKSDGAAALMAAKPARLVDALDELIARGMTDMPGAFPAGPAYGTDFLPEDPVVAMADGTAHQVPLIVGTNAEEGRLFTRFMPLLPTNERMIEKLLTYTDVASRDRITAAYPDYPSSAACIRLGGDFAFGTAAWQVAEAHSRHSPTYVYRYDYAPRTLHWSGLGATHATELFAVFDVYRTKFGALLTAAADRRSAHRVSNDVQARWRGFSRTGTPGDGWPSYTEDSRAVMVFDRRSHLEYDPAADRRLAWEGFSLAAQ